MLDELRDLVEKTPTNVLSQRLKKNPELFKWVQEQTKHKPNAAMATVQEKVYQIMYPETEIICGNGNERKYISFKKGYGFCGNLKSCICYRDHIKSFPRNTDQMVENQKKTWLRKYGVSNPMKVVSVKENVLENRKESVRLKKDLWRADKIKDGYSQVIDRVKNHVSPEFVEEDYSGCFRKNLYEWRCNTCGNVFEDHIDYGRVPKCLICNPKEVSEGEKEIRDFLSDYGISFETNTKEYIYPLELDIYVPDKRIAIEYNGIYWHSDKKKNKTYHAEKFLSCKKNGIHLIQIFEDEWKGKQEIVKNRLKNVLGVDKTLYARKCTVGKIDGHTYKKFCNENHLQGYAPASVCYGLFYDEDLVAVMSFSKSRYTDDDYELVRYCSKNTIVGGASKLFVGFLKEYNPSSIISYSNRAWSQGNMYRRLGFVDVTDNEKNTGYWYVKGDTRYHRSAFTKKRLVTMGFPEEKTEKEIMSENGFLRVYDCGNFKFRWIRPSNNGVL